MASATPSLLAITVLVIGLVAIYLVCDLHSPLLKHLEVVPDIKTLVVESCIEEKRGAQEIGSAHGIGGPGSVRE